MAEGNSLGKLIEVVADTNVVNNYLRGETYFLPKDFPDKFRIFISFATLTELLLWVKLIEEEESLSAEEKQALKNDLMSFLAEVEVIHSTEEICETAADLAFRVKKKTGGEFRRRWSDIFIAASARVLGIPVLTRNENDKDQASRPRRSRNRQEMGKKIDSGTNLSPREARNCWWAAEDSNLQPMD
ncbi:type II toxin-antitoxin system VapC family toxin [Thermosulfurimonas dismutans]|uniref:type II toxin-antitoxin system VapC family toxin n=1 Tax=Thermosulfurimonas dismutans TaxID=999894 RepID=UPI000A00000A